jgi:hypothetical protein
LRWRLRRLPAAAGAVGSGLGAVGWVGAVGVRTGLFQSTRRGDPLSAICQHTALAKLCAEGRRLDPLTWMSWDDVVRNMVLDSSVWYPHPLHTAEVTGSIPVTPTSKNGLRTGSFFPSPASKLPGFAARSRQDAASPPAATRAPAAARRRSPGSGEQTAYIVQPLLEFAWPWTRRPEDPAVRRGRTRAAQPDPGHPRGPFAPQLDPPD